MNIVKAVLLGIILVAWILLFSKLYFNEKRSVIYKNKTKFLVRVGIFSSISVLLYTVPFLKFPVPFFPSFLEFHFDEIPVFVAGFAYGPFSALCVLLVKTLIKLPLTTTLGVGELADLVYSSAFTLPAVSFYKKHRNLKSAIIGLSIGTLLQLIVSLLMNIYLMIPFYMSVMGFSNEALLYLCRLANSNISNMKWSFGLIAVLPFNIIKDIVVVIVTIFVYKSLHKFIDNLQD